MRPQFRKLFLILLLTVGLAAAQSLVAQETYVISSPNGKLSIKLIQAKDGTFFYSVKSSKKQVIQSSPLGYKLESGESIPSTGWVMEKSSQRRVNSTWKPIWGKRSLVPDKYNELIVYLATSYSSGWL